MKQSIHELLPEMAWQAEVLYELGRIVKLLQSIEAKLPARPDVSADVDSAIFDDMDWESTDLTVT